MDEDFTNSDLYNPDRLPAQERTETGALLCLSLFLLLLAFFILLNSLTTIVETNSRLVLNSVASAFRTSQNGAISTEILISTIKTASTPTEMLEEIERLWLTEIPFVKFKHETQGRHIMIDFPATQLFIGGDAKIRGDRSDLINATAHVLSSGIGENMLASQAILFVNNLDTLPLVPDPDIGLTRTSAMIVDPDDPEASLELAQPSFDASTLAFSRAGILARELIDKGVPSSNLAVGIRAGDDGRIRFRFFIHADSLSALSFHEEQANIHKNAGSETGGGNVQNVQ